MTKTFVPGEVLTAADVNTFLVNNGFQFAGTRYYTSSGQFEKADPLGTGDIGLRAIRVTVVGGGGAGGGGRVTTGSQVSPASGGGSGGWSQSFITDIAGLAASVTVTRGGGGSGNLAADGSKGGDSSFGSIVTAPGGPLGFSGGAGAPPASRPVSIVASDYSAGVGDVARGPTPGQGGISLSLSADGNFHMGGAGGSNPYGSGGFGQRAFRLDQPDATGFGGGGGGFPSGPNDATGETGGDGSDGIVIVDCFV